MIEGQVTCLADIVRQHAIHRGQRPAVRFGNETVTFSALDQRSNRVASALRRHGVGPGDRVAYLGQNLPEFLEVLFGCAKVGAVPAPVNWRFTAPEVAQVIADAGASVVFVDADVHELAAEAGDLADRACSFVALRGGPGGIPGMAAYDAWIGPPGAADPGHRAAAADHAIQLYTSGTTGLPKGVLTTTANLLFTLPRMARTWDFHERSVNLVAFPVNHVAGCVWGLIGMWLGGETVLLRRARAEWILQAIGHHQVTHTLLVPTLLRRMLDAMDTGTDAASIPSLEFILYGASPISEDLLRRCLRRFRCKLVQSYAMTETTGQLAVLAADDHTVDGPGARLLRSAGRPLPWVEVRVVDTRTEEDVAAGEVGEIWCRSGGTMAGYWRHPEETAAALTPDGWLRTGDAGYVDPEGYIFLCDRLKDMIVTGAENVYPADVENVLDAHPDIREVAVVGVPHPDWGEAVMAVIVRREGADLTADDVMDYARTRLAGFKRPKSVAFVDRLPVNPTGKVLRRELRERYWRDHGRRIS